MAIYISLLFGIIVFCVIISALYYKGKMWDKINDRLIRISGANNEIIIDEEMQKPLNERLFKPIIESVVKFVGRIVPNEMDAKKSEYLRKMLRQAGITILPSEYNAIRLVTIIGTALLFGVIGFLLNLSNLAKIGAPLFGAYAAFTILRFHLAGSITKRREMMERQMPDVFDMISVSVEAGLGFEQALLHVLNHFEGPLIDELTITYREMSMGRSRRDALQLLGERCGIEDLKTFTSAVIQAGKLGISLKNVLRTQSDGIRSSRKAKIQEKAMKISVKMLIPMMLFIFPVIFIMLMGPALISIMELL